MIHLDPATLLIVTFLTTVLIGALFLLSWRQAPTTRALPLWGAAHLTGALASGGLALRGLIPDALSIGLANALMLVAYGLIWSGVRTFEERPVRAGLALAGAGAWCMLCLVPSFYGSIDARIGFASAAAGLYCAVSAWEIWRGRTEPLASRPAATILMTLHGGLYAVRIPAIMLAPTGVNPLTGPWMAAPCLLVMLVSTASAVLFIALVKERAEREQRIAARTDPLTGAANRRAFTDVAQAALRGRGRVALLLCDLDRFKGINDTYGHAVGDAVIVGFCETAAALLPPGALLGRMGGEEFACVLPGVSPAAARARAEVLRRTFARLRVPELPDLRLSVSVGIAHARDGIDFDALLRHADAALYAAKGRGRDRVEVAGSDLPQAA